MTKSIYTLLAIAVSASMAFANGGGDDEKKGGLFQDAGKVSFKPGSGVTFDGGDEFRLTFKSCIQTAYTNAAYDNSLAAPTNNFQVRRVEMWFYGNAFSKDLNYKLTLDPSAATGATNPIIKDVWAQYDFFNRDGYKLGLRFGESKTMFGLEATSSVAGLYFPDRSSASNTFANSRSRGAWLFGSGMENKIRWNLGAQNADVAAGAQVLDVGEDANNSDNELTYVANVSFDPWGDTTGGKTTEALQQGDLEGVQEFRGTIGGGIMLGNNKQAAVTGPDVESTEYNLNFGGKIKGFAVMGEFFARGDDVQGGASFDSTGWYVQGTYTLPKSGESPLQWGFGARYSMVNLGDAGGMLSTQSTNFSQASGTGVGGATSTAKGDVSELTIGVDAFYHGHAAKTQLAFTRQMVNPDAGSDTSNNIFQVMFQLVF